MRRTESPSPEKLHRNWLLTIQVRRGIKFLILIALIALLVLTRLEFYRGLSREVASGRDLPGEDKSTAAMSVTERACVAQLPSCRPAIAPPHSSPSDLKPIMERRINLVRPFSVARCSPVKLQAMGPAFLSPLYARWFNEFHKLHPEVEFDYQFIGNVPPVRGLLNGALDFAVTDMPISDEQFKQRPGLQVPTKGGARRN